MVGTDCNDGEIPLQALQVMDMHMDTTNADTEDGAYQSAKQVPRCDDVQEVGVRASPLRRNRKRSLRSIEGDYTREGAAASVAAKKPSSISNSDGNMHTCEECGKQFQNVKALFGHLRSHPDRLSRRIHRPNASNGNKETIRWSSGERRLKGSPRKKAARSKLNAASRKSIGESVEEGIGAIEHTKRTAAEATAVDNESDTESIEALYIACGDRQPSDFGLMLLANTACALEESERKLLDERPIGGSPELELVPKELQEKASSTTEDDELDQQQEGNEEMINGNRNRSKNTSKEHVCNVCGRTFYTGQALGGHKRRHYRKAGASVRFPGFPPNFAQQIGVTDYLFLDNQPAAAA